MHGWDNAWLRNAALINLLLQIHTYIAVLFSYLQGVIKVVLDIRFSFQDFVAEYDIKYKE